MRKLCANYVYWYNKKYHRCSEGNKDLCLEIETTKLSDEDLVRAIKKIVNINNICELQNIDKNKRGV